MTIARQLFLALLMLSLTLTSTVRAQDTETATTTDAAPNVARPVTVAVLEFETGDESLGKLGRDIADTLTALLSAEDLALVDRQDIQRTLDELALSQSGLVNTNQALKVGKLVGARIIITGRAFPVGQQTFITAKIIGTETTRVMGVLVKGDPQTQLPEMLLDLSTQVTQRVREAGERGLLPPDDAASDPLPALVKDLAKRQRPKMAVIVFEEHMAPRVVAPDGSRVPDPAVETEMKRLLLAAGFTVQDVRDNELAKWARTLDPKNPGAWPRQLANVDVVVTGEAFSEAIAPIGRFTPATARAEINVIDRHTGKIVLSEAVTTRGVDLSINIAAKKALQRAGHELGIKLLRTFANILPLAEPVPDANEAGQ